MPNLFNKLFRHAEAKSVPLPGGVSGRTGQTSGAWALSDLRLPGGMRNPAVDVGDAYLNDVVAACLGWIIRAYGECQPRVERLEKDAWQPVPEHPLSQLLRRPNPTMSGRLLRRAIAFDLAISGNAYLKAEKDAYGRVRELWWLPADYMGLSWGRDPNTPVDAYVYTVNGLRHEYAPEEVVHLRTAVDPRNPRLGLASIVSAYRSIDVDNRVSAMYGGLLRNMGLIPLMFSPSEGALDADERTQLAADIALGYTGENAGSPIIASTALNAAKLAQSPDEMAVVEIREQVTRRICADMGLDPLVVGLDASSATFANKELAVRNAWENRILPDLALLGEDYEVQLLPLVEARPDAYRLTWDTSAVKALQEGEDAKAKRADTAIRAGGVSVNEYRAMLGLPPVTETIAGINPDIPRGEPAFAASVAREGDGPSQGGQPMG